MQNIRPATANKHLCFLWLFRWRLPVYRRVLPAAVCSVSVPARVQGDMRRCVTGRSSGDPRCRWCLAVANGSWWDSTGRVWDVTPVSAPRSEQERRELMLGLGNAGDVGEPVGLWMSRSPRPLEVPVDSSFRQEVCKDQYEARVSGERLGGSPLSFSFITWLLALFWVILDEVTSLFIRTYKVQQTGWLQEESLVIVNDSFIFKSNINKWSNLLLHKQHESVGVWILSVMVWLWSVSGSWHEGWILEVFLLSGVCRTRRHLSQAVA